MKILVPLACLLAGAVCAQPQTGSATVKDACSVANTGNNNTFTITCGVGKQQGDALLKIMNRIIANQLDPDAVMTKLDEILKAVNPNLAAKTYFCNGQWRTAGPSASAAFAIMMGGDDSIFQNMIQLNNSRQYSGLLKLCAAQIQSTPEWLTPRLFCALAYLGIGDKEKARSMFAEFEVKTGPAYDDADACKQMAAFLRANLQ